MSRALKVVARLRKLAIDEARIELAAQLAIELRAAEADRAAQAAIQYQQQSASTLAPEDSAFTTWLPSGLQARSLAREAASRAEAATHAARTALADARAAGEVVDKMLARHAAERLAEADRREQAMFDDVGQRPPAS